MSDSILLEMKNITKRFPGVIALDNVSFRVKKGEIHCLVGENGAGKSTLMKVLSGVHPYGSYEGDIIFDGKVQQFKGIKDSEAAGIGIIYQELALVPYMTVYENVYLGHEIQKNGIVDWNETIKHSHEMLKKVKLEVNPAELVRHLGVGKQQLIEIAKALSRRVTLLILDEPTAALNEDDSENLLKLIQELREQGVTSVMISHKLSEVLAIADTVTVLRDGQSICTLDSKTDNLTNDVLVKNMVGRSIENIYPDRSHTIADEAMLEVKNLTAYDPRLGRKILKDINFKVKKGEIVGLAGLMGSGRTELAKSVFGNPDEYKIEGTILHKNKEVKFHHPEDAIKDGIAYVTEDRKGDGLILIQDIKQNITLANLNEIAKLGVVNDNEEVKIGEKYSQDLKIKTPSIEQKVGNLSGGNQQKVSLAKWLFSKPDVLILDEPTRGIDVGAKYEIYTIMNKLVEEGMSIIMISSELPEVLGMSDRIYVVASGMIAGELTAQEATQEKIMHMATN
jgi:putative multiple sugar transport system ATP-binding protein